MNYIYDIILNFNNTFYEFYDWNQTDKITEIKKIPIFKVNSRVLNDIKYNNILLSDKFINKVKNKCEYYIGRTIKLNTAFLLTDGIDIIAISLEKNIKYSSLQIDEELDILDELNIDETIIEYKIIAHKKLNHFKTRNQVENETILREKINKMLKENNEAKIKYIYYECFNEKLSDINLIKEKFLNMSNINEISHKLNNIFNNIKKTINN